MANAAVASWTACVKELQELAAAPSVAQRDGDAVLQRVEKLQDQPPLPHAAWKRLAQDVQVRQADNCRRGNAWQQVLQSKEGGTQQPSMTHNVGYCTCPHS